MSHGDDMDLQQIRCDCECRNSPPLEINPTSDIEDPRLVGTSCSNIVPVSTSSVDVCANFCQVCFASRRKTFMNPDLSDSHLLSKYAGMSFWKKHWQLPRSLSTSSIYMGVSKNRDTPKSSILIGFSIINHPFWGAPIFGNTHIFLCFRISNHQFPQPSEWRTAPPKGLVLGAAAAAAAPKGLDAAGGPPIGGPIGGGPAGGPELSPFSTGSLGGWVSCAPEERFASLPHQLPLT